MQSPIIVSNIRKGYLENIQWETRADFVPSVLKSQSVTRPILLTQFEPSELVWFNKM